MRTWIREPLVWFAVLGAGIFALAELGLGPTPGSVAGEGSAPSGERRIEVSAARVEWLSDGFEARWMRAPTEAELRGLVDAFVRQDVLYRAALAMGLDRDDEIVRRRMVQKLELMTQDIATLGTPAEADLQAFFAVRSEAYRVPERRRFVQVYFNVDARGGEAARRAAEELAAELGTEPGEPDELLGRGDRLLLPLEDAPLAEVDVARQLGVELASALFALEPGHWAGPLDSAYGVHAVRVTEVIPSALPQLEDVRSRVLLDYASEAQARASEELYARLAEEYDIVVDEQAIRRLAGGAQPGAGP